MQNMIFSGLRQNLSSGTEAGRDNSQVLVRGHGGDQDLAAAGAEAQPRQQRADRREERHPQQADLGRPQNAVPTRRQEVSCCSLV